MLAFMCICDWGACTPTRPVEGAGTFPEGASVVPARATGRLSVLALVQRQLLVLALLASTHAARLAASHTECQHQQLPWGLLVPVAL